jgi:hypothetical protein
MADLSETVWREDIIDQIEVARDSCKVLDSWIQRLAYQGAPVQLIQQLTDTRESCGRVYRQLEDLKACFPSPHQKRYGY